MMKTGRVLFPWLDPRESVMALNGFRMTGSDVDSTVALALHAKQRHAVESRPPFDDAKADLDEPFPAEIAEAAAAAARVCQSVGASRDARPAIVDLTRVLTFQKAVVLDGIDERVAAAQQDDWRSLADVCLPAWSPHAEALLGTFDRDGKSVTFSSLNPNLRAGPLQNVKVENGRVIGFPVLFGLPFVRVTVYRDRFFLLDGYHRAYGLLERGITRIPCLRDSARSFSDVTPHGVSTIQQEHLMGAHPPLMTDYLDPEVSVTVQMQAFRKVLRITAEEFNVNV